MSRLGKLVRNVVGRVSRAVRGTARKRIKASYDAAQTTAENANHWYWADSLNANAANSTEVRRTLRERARYETENNGYLGGLVDKLGKDLVGRGPRVQLRIPGVGRDVCRRIEAAFMQWARQIGLGQKLRLLDNAAVRDGEGFALLTNNPRLDPSGVQLDLRLYETDQVSTPFLDWGDDKAFDGGRLDDFGNVTEWHFLKTHPGSDVWSASYLDVDKIDSRDVIHWYTPKRAGQVRGVPEVLSSLTLFAYLRRYTLAVVTAAETAANLAGVMQTDGTAQDGDAPTVETMDEVALARGALLTLPSGWTATQFKPEQPTNTYKDFKGEILTEAGQPVGAPRNVSTGSSAEYNYSSGRLDLGIYQRGVGVRRSDLRDRVLDQIFRAWLDEAALVPGLIPDGLPLRVTWSWDWYFDGFTSLDPQKDAETDAKRLETKTTTYAEIFAERGQDWEEAFEQMARERARMKELGLDGGGAAPSPGLPKPPAPDAEPEPVASSRKPTPKRREVAYAAA
jgi:lambda family phage portal protein